MHAKRLVLLAVVLGIALVLAITADELTASRDGSGPVDEPIPQYPTCYGKPDYDICGLFTERCASCHTGGPDLAAPGLTGLLGRERTFESGESLVADEAYIRRAIADHDDEVEWIPGYTTQKRDLRELREPPLSSDEVSALARYIQNLKPHPLIGDVRVSRVLATDAASVERTDRIMHVVSETLRDCYEHALVDHPEIRGSHLVEFRLDEVRRPHGNVVNPFATHPITANCVRYAIEGLSYGHRVQGPLVARYQVELSSRPRH